MGIITFAPAKIALLWSPLQSVARAVVAGIRAEGISSLVMAIALSVSSILPALWFAKGVSGCGIKGPMPTI